MPTYTVLVVDDEKEIRDGIEIFLKNEGIQVMKAKDGIEAIEILKSQEIHLIVLDVMMPRLDGIKTTIQIRKEKNIPIIILSAKSEDTDKILGLSVGADDYVTKPFHPLELIARVKAQLRRYVTLGTYQGADKVIAINGLVLNEAAKEVTLDGEVVKLTPIEYRIVELLMKNAGRVFSTSEIYERVWKEPGYNAENTVAVHIRQQSLAEHNEAIKQSGLVFRLNFPNTPVYALVDGQKMWRVFDNLIGNILKYALENTRVYISVQTVGDEIHITFKNVTKYELGENVDELIERFKRGDTSRHTDGSGLGLAIAKSILDLHGGRLDIEVDGDLFKVTVILEGPGS